MSAVAPYIVHVGYVLMLGAFLARDVLWLRSLLSCAQMLVVIYAFHSGVLSIAAWNLLFAVINAVWAGVILAERRKVALPPELRPVYTRHFAALTPQEFLRLWGQAHRETIRDRQLVRAGSRPDSLYFLLKGVLRVSRDGVLVTDLPSGYFAGEMSLLTGDPAIADVDAIGAVEVMRWSTAELHATRERAPLLWTKIQSVLGHDIVEKLQRTPARAAAGEPELV